MKKNIKKMYVLIISLFITLIPTKIFASIISLDKNRLTVGTCDECYERLHATIPSELNESNIIWRSSNESIATVDQNGKVTGITEGKTTIIATINGNRTECEVTVSSDYVKVTGVSLNKSTLEILLGSSETLIKTITPSNATNQDVIWTSSDSNIVSVNKNGKVTAKNIGTATIIASNHGYRSECKINVVKSIVLKSITINKSALTIKEQASEKLEIKYSPTNATNKKITWRSSNNTIATVDQNGKVTGIKPGSATITAVSDDGGIVATTKVTVEALSKKVTGVTLDKKEVSLIAGETTQINATISPNYAENKEVTWTSSNENIATVENGKITAISPGEAEIKVVTKDENKEAICKVVVKSPPVKKISFKEQNKTVYIKSKTKLLIITEPTNAILENQIWTSSNENVAKVENGTVTALSLGETTITVSNNDKTITASMTIKVIEKPKEELKITIEGYDLKFDPKVKNYTLKIGSDKELIINTNLSEDKVIINGNKNLKDGSLITITVSNEEKTTYVINIKKKENYTIIFIGIISVLLIINLIRLFIKSKKSKLK